VRRYIAGISYERDEFALLENVDPGGPLPEDRELLYPWLGFEIVQDRYEERRNQDQIRRTEECCWASAPARGWVTPPNRSGPIAMR
jgi:hypothetical protein